MQPSNFEVNVVATGKEEFDKVLSLFFEKNTEVKWYSMSPEYGMGLYQYESGGGTICINGKSVELGAKQSLPYPMKFEATKDFLWNWLKNCPEEYLGKQRDMDGTIEKGAWRMRNTHSYCGPLVIVKPEWAEYHK